MATTIKPARHIFYFHGAPLLHSGLSHVAKLPGHISAHACSWPDAPCPFRPAFSMAGSHSLQQVLTTLLYAATRTTDRAAGRAPAYIRVPCILPHLHAQGTAHQHIIPPRPRGDHLAADAVASPTNAAHHGQIGLRTPINAVPLSRVCPRRKMPRWFPHPPMPSANTVSNCFSASSAASPSWQGGAIVQSPGHEAACASTSGSADTSALRARTEHHRAQASWSAPISANTCAPCASAMAAGKPSVNKGARR